MSVPVEPFKDVRFCAAPRKGSHDKEKRGQNPAVFIVLDELNKYAPREGRSPIKNLLVEIAERGRSLGIVLIGAQQTASEVERRVVGSQSRTPRFFESNC